MRASELWSRSVPELRRVMAGLYPVRPEDVAGHAYRGVALGLPRAIERLTWKTFMKAFVADAGAVRGFNVRLHQDRDVRLDALEVRPRTGRDGALEAFGHFLVRPALEEILLDYGVYAGRLDPMRALRDPVRALNEGDPTTLLGMSWLDVLGRRVDTPSWFTLERIHEAPDVPAPRRR